MTTGTVPCAAHSSWGWTGMSIWGRPTGSDRVGLPAEGATVSQQRVVTV